MHRCLSLSFGKETVPVCAMIVAFPMNVLSAVQVDGCHHHHLQHSTHADNPHTVHMVDPDEYLSHLFQPCSVAKPGRHLVIICSTTKQKLKFWQALNTTKKDKLLHLSYHFSLFLTISLLFKCCFVAWRRGFPWKFALCCRCHNKWAFFRICRTTLHSYNGWDGLPRLIREQFSRSCTDTCSKETEYISVCSLCLWGISKAKGQSKQFISPL